MLAVLWERHCRPIVLLVSTRRPTDRLRSLASAAVAMDHTVIDRSCTTQWSQRRNANLSGGASVSVRRVNRQCVRASERAVHVRSTAR